MKKIIKHPILITSIVLLVALVVGIYTYNSVTRHPNYDYSSPVVKNITENVSVTGQVKAVDVVNLAFERAGKISRVYVAVGDKVVTGQNLVALGAHDALDDLASAEAALSLAEAQASIQGTQMDNAKAVLIEAETSLLDKIQNTYIAADDAVRTQASQLFTNPAGDNPQLNLVIPNQDLTVNIQNERKSLETSLTNWNLEILRAASSSVVTSGTWDNLSEHSRENLLSVKQFLDDCADALNIALPNHVTPQASISAWKLAVTSSRLSVSNALISLSTADSQLITAESAYLIAEQQVNNNSSSATSVSQAQIKQAQVAVDRAKSALAKTVLRAPFDGVVSRVDAKLGQTVSIGLPVVGMISNANYQIEGFVSEADAGKISSGQVASITLDAYGSSTIFPAKVVLVDPTETIQNNIPSYKVTFELINNDDRAKPGMTANVSVFIASKVDVLTVPESAIVRRGTEEFVLVAPDKNSTAKPVKVVTGLRGSDGSVEIISGLKTSDLIVSLF